MAPEPTKETWGGMPSKGRPDLASARAIRPTIAEWFIALLWGDLLMSLLLGVARTATDGPTKG